MMRLLIADASDALRIGLRMIFSLDPQHIIIVAEESCANAVLNSARLYRPDMIIIDGDLEGAQPIIQRIAKLPGLLALIVLTMNTDPLIKQRMGDDGASICIEKRASPQELLNYVRAVVHANLAVPLAA